MMLKADPYAHLQGRLLDHLIDAEPFVGAVVVARVLAPKLAREYDDPELLNGKPRPAIVKAILPPAKGFDRRTRQFYEHPTRYEIWGLTTLRFFANGNKRTPCPGYENVGLLQSCYCWGGRTVTLPSSDVDGVIWAAPPTMVLACALAEVDVDPALARETATRISLQVMEGGWQWPKGNR